MVAAGRSFYYSVPTKYVFGRESMSHLAESIAPYRKVLFLHGHSAIAALGLDQNVNEILAELGADCREIDYCTSNPDSELVERICEECDEFKPDVILAAGGGSAIDAAKAASVLWGARTAMGHPISFHDVLPRLKEVNLAIPIGVILTLPASGSECNNSFVIHDKAIGKKIARAHPLAAPKFAICNPSVMDTLSDFQLACACSDIMAHLLEQLFCAQGYLDHIDMLIYSSISSLLESYPSLFVPEERSRAQENIMALSSLALSYFFSTGRQCDWIAHEIDHRLSGFLPGSHGQVLAAVIPAWIRVASSNEYYRLRLNGFEQHCSYSMKNKMSGIEVIEKFYADLQLPLSEIALTIHENKDDFVNRIMSGGALGRCISLTPGLCEEVLRLIGKWQH